MRTSFRLLAAAPFLLSAAAMAATEYGTVVSSTPVLGQVAVPQRDCYDEQVSRPARPSGGGALVGGVIGGVLGNAVGHGSGRAAATAIGAVAGAVIGDSAERNSTPRSVSTVRRCQTTQYQEDRIIGYDVVYDYAGTRRSVRLPSDPGGPGTRIALEVNVVPAAAPRGHRQGHPVPPAGSRSYSTQDDAVGTPVDDDYTESTTVYEQTRYVPVPAYYAPYPAYYGAPAVISIGGHWGGHHHRHWRPPAQPVQPVQPVDPVRRRHDPAHGRL